MTDLDKEAIEIVNQLFEKLTRIKPAFKQAWPTDYQFNMVKREWVASFKDNNIHSLNQIKKAYEKLRDAPSAFIPSPGEFIELCKPEPQDINAPDLKSAYSEACLKSHPTYGPDKNWSHVAVRNAAREVGSHELRSEPASKTKPMFKKAYEKAIKDYSDNRNMDQIENKRQDNPENKRKYQDYYGDMKQRQKLGAISGDTEVLSYEQWLSMG